MPPSLFSSTYSIPHPHNKSLDALQSRFEHVEQRERDYRGTIRPCGKGTIGFAPRKKLTKADAKYERESNKVRGIRYVDVDEESGEYLSTSTYVRQSSLIPDSCLPCQEYQWVATENRTALSLTTRGRKYIEDGCFLLERKLSPRRLGFYTLTLSLTDKSEIDAFNSRAATILKRYLEKIKRHYERIGEKFLYVGCWELHPSRSAKCGYPVLHFHYVAPAYRKNTWQFICSPGKIRSTWTESVRTGIGAIHARVCRVGCEIIKFSAGGYLGKYMSKGSLPTASDSSQSDGVRLSSWYSISRNLLRLIHKCCTPVGRFIGNNSTGDSIENFLASYTAVHGCIVEEINGKRVLLGYWYELNPYFHGCLLVTIDAILSEET